jgi:DNA sulfur modification protein DndB
MIREDGEVMNSEEAITLTCAKIKRLIGIPLGKDELAKESHR